MSEIWLLSVWIGIGVAGLGIGRIGVAIARRRLGGPVVAAVPAPDEDLLTAA